MAMALSQEERITIHTEDHMQNSFKRLNHMRQEGELCDVTLVVEDVEIPAHKTVLASCSPYFYSMFTNKGTAKQKRIELDVKPQLLRSVVNYMYTSTMTVLILNIKDVIAIAEMLLLKNLQKECFKILQRIMNPSNCLVIKTVASEYGEKELLTNALSFVDTHFEDVTSSKYFLNLNNDQVCELISRDTLVIPSEEKVYECVIKWINHDPKERRKYLRFLMGYVRLSFMSKGYIKQYIIEDSFLKGDAYCKDLIINALLESDTTNSATTKPRRYFRYVKILLAVGGLESEATKSLEYFDFEKRSWSKIFEMPFSISFAGLAAINQTVYLAGGVTNRQTTHPVRHYNVSTNVWHDMIDTTIMRTGHSVAVLNNCIYAVGGYDGKGDGLNSAEKFDLKLQKWKPIEPMFIGRCELGIGILHGILYVIGGRNTEGSLKSVECYNEHTNSWKKLSDMKECRSGVGVCALDGKIYAIGGWNGSCCLKSVEVYDPDTDSWIEIASMNVPRAWAGVTIVDDQICVIGGQNNPFNGLKSMEVYNKLINSWSILPEVMNVARSRHSVVTVLGPI